MEQEEVAEVAVAGRPHPVFGAKDLWLTSWRKPFDAADLEAHCRRDFASFKIPPGFIAVESLSGTALGKVQIRMLPSWVSERQNRLRDNSLTHVERFTEQQPDGIFGNLTSSEF